MTQQRTVRVKHAAVLADVSVRTMTRWVRDGLVESVRVRGTRLISVASLRRVLKGHGEHRGGRDGI